MKRQYSREMVEKHNNDKQLRPNSDELAKASVIALNSLHRED
jgi:hypothetical protein